MIVYGVLLCIDDEGQAEELRVLDYERKEETLTKLYVEYKGDEARFDVKTSTKTEAGEEVTFKRGRAPAGILGPYKAFRVQWWPKCTACDGEGEIHFRKECPYCHGKGHKRE